MDYGKLAENLSRRLQDLGTPERAVGEKAYLKSDLQHFGVTVPVIRGTVKHFLVDTPIEKRAAVTGLVRALWQEPIHERRVAAIEIITFRRDVLRRPDLPLLERLLRECRGWALLDNLATQAGLLLESLSGATPVLDRWATDEDFWMRRAALLADLLPLREGRGDFARFSRYADMMLEEKEFFIRKAIGWVLRDLSRQRPELTIGWSAPRLHRMSGVTIREVVRRLEPDIAGRLMTGYKARESVLL
ncbi:MAG: DNA alkylation repair protein [bacterium]|nr:DNA alkylation repair protein [bacterium]